MIESVLLIVATALVTWVIMRWLGSKPLRPKALSLEEKEADRAKDIGTQLDRARDRASQGEVERNKLALAKAVKAALWVTEARLNFAVPELLKLAQLWVGQAKVKGKKWEPPKGVTDIQGLDNPTSPWAAWKFNEQDWRIEAQWRPSIAPEVIQEDIGNCKVFVDHQVVLDMAIGSNNREVLWIDALTVGPWVSELLTFAGVQKSDAQVRTSAKSARQNQERADNIRWS